MSEKRMVSVQFDSDVAHRLRVTAAERDVSQSEILRLGVQILMDDPEALTAALQK